jgi:hypothetical protein
LSKRIRLLIGEGLFNWPISLCLSAGSSRTATRSFPRAIDGYKVQHRRRFVTFEEMLSVIKSLGYKR